MSDKLKAQKFALQLKGAWAQIDHLASQNAALVEALEYVEDMAVPDEFLSDEERLKHIVKLARTALEKG